MIEELKKHLLSEGKTDSWLNLAIQFNILPNGTNKQRSDKVRKIFNSLPYTVTDAPSTQFSEGINYNNQFYNTTASTSNLVFRTNESNTEYNYGTPFPFTGIGDVIQPVIKPNTPAWEQQLDEVRNKEWEEFRKWKESKVGLKIPVSIKHNGIHLVLPDVHIPYHNKELITKLLSFIQDNKHQIVGFHILGDFLDLGSLSKHDENTIDNSGWTLGREYEAGNLLLDAFESILPKNIRKTYLYGNHEDRYFRYVSNVKNYKTADAIMSPTQALKLKERGYEVYENWKEDFVQVGKYQIIHGTYCGTNPSKQHLDKLRSSVIFGHTHRINHHFDLGLHGLNIGTLSDINSSGFKYLSRVERQQWMNGFGIVNVAGDHSQAEVIICNDNKFFYGGKQY